MATAETVGEDFVTSAGFVGDGILGCELQKDFECIERT